MEKFELGKESSIDYEAHKTFKEGWGESDKLKQEVELAQGAWLGRTPGVSKNTYDDYMSVAAKKTDNEKALAYYSAEVEYCARLAKLYKNVATKLEESDLEWKRHKAELFHGDALSWSEFEAHYRNTAQYLLNRMAHKDDKASEDENINKK